jgi:hypothetical protein
MKKSGIKARLNMEQEKGETMANESDKREADRFASGTRGTDIDEAGNDGPNPGVTGGKRTYLPGSGGAEKEGSAASSAEGTIGAVGEMDITGAPAGATASGGVSGGSSAGASEGGGPGGGASSSGGTGPGTKEKPE